MRLAGIENTGGSNRSKKDTLWEHWWQEVLVHFSKRGGSMPDEELKNKYFNLYNDGYTVHDAFIVMY